ncbi:hypothetical protein QFZ35_003180 [Arthrobacter ulcerisalmonis]|nr:hypothetical protein [Arthrobacter ulcerisalmonis]MDQ0664682.1 hypothetical protein [Arthrobacter ulcerisalmonis]
MEFLDVRVNRANLDPLMAGKINAPGSAVATALSTTYASAFADSQAITYNTDGSVATVTDIGVTATYTYNSDGTVATDSRVVNGAVLQLILCP